MTRREEVDLAAEAASNGRVLYLELARELMSRISQGQYPVGQSFPKELDLMREFDVSRNTVRSALSLLESEDIILRRKRAGTTVLRSNISEPRKVVFNDLSSLSQITKGTVFIPQVSDRRKLPAHVRSQISSATDGQWHYVSGVRRRVADDKPTSITTVYLHPDLEEVHKLVGREQQAIFQLVERVCGISLGRMETKLSPVLLTPDQAALLNLPEAALGVELNHIVHSRDGDVLEVAWNIYPKDNFDLQFHFDLSNV